MAQPPPLYPYWNDSPTVLLRKILTNTALIAETGGGGGGSGNVSKVAVPANSGSSGALGQVAWDGSYFYTYVVGTGWLRTPMSDWA